MGLCERLCPWFLPLPSLPVHGINSFLPALIPSNALGPHQGLSPHGDCFRVSETASPDKLFLELLCQAFCPSDE